MFYLVRTPSWFIRLNSSLVWNIPTEQKELYLTFDDGPHETATPFVLDQLKAYNARATFFCLGKNVKAYPKIYERILDEGHAVGNHTFSHLNGWKTNNNTYMRDIAEAAKYIDSKLFRPPYGKLSPFVSKLLRSLNYRIVMWEILSGDFDTEVTPEKCLEHVVLYSRPGSVIVFHDSTKAWQRMQFALPKVLQHFNEQGFKFKGIPQ
ncbi:MAG TPA: polysaccharide deacetylase family protein [Parafilimonas sp.]|nr:polysaccharide deacetylase family protein [Parafilimonas sp.]